MSKKKILSNKNKNISKIKVFFKHLLLGYKSYWEAIKFIFKHGLSWYFLVPLLINIIFVFGGFGATIKVINFATETFKTWIDFDTKSFLGHQYLNEFFVVIIGILISVLFFVAFMYLSGHIIMILFSPLLSFVSEKVDRILTNKDFPFEWKQFFSDVLRGILIAVRNILIELFCIILMFFISFIPIVGWFSPIVLFIVSSYYYGFSFMDYTNERRGLSFWKSIKYIQKHKGLAYANGSIFSLALLIPFCGVSIATFVAIISTVAATLSMEKIKT